MHVKTIRIVSTHSAPESRQKLSEDDHFDILAVTWHHFFFRKKKENTTIILHDHQIKFRHYLNCKLYMRLRKVPE